MIFDRTQEDVNAAIYLRDSKVKNFVELTDEDINALERGTITVNTLNRIENKQKEIKELFFRLGISVNIENKVWNNTEIFDEANFKRILSNLKNLVNAFCVYKNTPAVPSASYRYKNINSIEKILVDLEELYNKILKSFKYCGIVYCGKGLNYDIQG